MKVQHKKRNCFQSVQHLKPQNDNLWVKQPRKREKTPAKHLYLTPAGSSFSPWSSHETTATLKPRRLAPRKVSKHVCRNWLLLNSAWMVEWCRSFTMGRRHFYVKSGPKNFNNISSSPRFIPEWLRQNLVREQAQCWQQTHCEIRSTGLFK